MLRDVRWWLWGGCSDDGYGGSFGQDGAAAMAVLVELKLASWGFRVVDGPVWWWFRRRWVVDWWWSRGGFLGRVSFLRKRGRRRAVYAGFNGGTPDWFDGAGRRSSGRVGGDDGVRRWCLDGVWLR